MNRAEEVISRLLNHYERRWSPRSADPFMSLVRIILSQNTGYRNQIMAYDRLEDTIGITPENLASSPVEDIAKAIRPAGMHNQRSRALKQVAESIIEGYGGDMTTILEKPFIEARGELMKLPGVGTKTADVLLMFEAGKKVVPVDRHIFRITRRLRLVPEKATYDDVRTTLEAAASPDRHEDVHVLLIRFGREVCKAQRPKCPECFLLDICPYPKEIS